MSQLLACGSTNLGVALSCFAPTILAIWRLLLSPLRVPGAVTTFSEIGGFVACVGRRVDRRVRCARRCVQHEFSGKGIWHVAGCRYWLGQVRRAERTSSFAWHVLLMMHSVGFITRVGRMIALGHFAVFSFSMLGRWALIHGLSCRVGHCIR